MMNPDSHLRRTRERLAAAARFAVLVICCSQAAAAQPVGGPTASGPILLDAPATDGPLEVRASFQLLSISAIDDEAERVTFSGVLTLAWKDERQAFDPDKAGVKEKVYSGAYQFNEVATGWYPQVTLANAFGQDSSQAVLLRVQPDGTSTLSQELDAVAKVNLDMRRYPFDHQRLELVFRVFGYDAHEIVFSGQPQSASASESLGKMPQWTLTEVEASTRTMHAPDSSATDIASALVVTMEVERQPIFMLRLVVLPLALIVILSWSVFWMDRSSVGDRMAVSFVGILTAVAYQITLGGIVPNVSYFTLMNGFLNLSFLLMCATVVINLYVGTVDRRGHERGDRVDRRCRWLFPLIYFGLNALALAVAILFF